MRASLGTMVAGVVLLAGCGGDPAVERDPESGPTNETSATPASEPEPSTLTQREIDRAITALGEQGDGRFVVETGLGAGGITTEGVFRLDTGYRFDLRADDPESGETTTTSVLATRRDSWFSIEMEGRRTCWMHGTKDELKELSGVQGGGNTIGIPPIVFVVSTLEVDDEGRVTSDLHSVLTMIGGRIPIELGLKPSATDRVDVVLEVVDGEVSTVSTEGAWLVEAIDEAGLDPGPLGAAAEQWAVTATLDEVDEPVVIEPPPAEFVVELSQDQEQFAADREECDARYADAS